MKASEGQVTDPLRVVLVDDSTLFRQGLAALLSAGGLQVVAELGDSEALPAVLEHEAPDVVIVDVRMPPTHTDEGIRVALRLREDHPQVGVLVLSTYAEGSWARQLFAHGSVGFGYLLKDGVDDVAALVGAIRRVASGGTAVDPEVITRLMQATNVSSVLDVLSQREREVLALMTEGFSNAGVAQRLHLSPRTVEAYIAGIFTKLALDAQQNTMNRRVLAVLTFLNERARSRSGDSVERRRSSP